MHRHGSEHSKAGEDFRFKSEREPSSMLGAQNHRKATKKNRRHSRDPLSSGSIIIKCSISIEGVSSLPDSNTLKLILGHLNFQSLQNEDYFGTLVGSYPLP
jgi:hypothetical protein